MFFGWTAAFTKLNKSCLPYTRGNYDIIKVMVHKEIFYFVKESLIHVAKVIKRGKVLQFLAIVS